MLATEAKMNGSFQGSEDIESFSVDLDTPAESDGTSGSEMSSSTGHHTCRAAWLRRNLFILLLLLSLVLAIGVGCCIKFATQLEFTDKELTYISFPGTLFLSMLEMVIVPLVVSSLVAGMSSLDKRASRVLGLKALVYIFATTSLATTLGIFLAMVIRPGSRQDSTGIARSDSIGYVNTVDSMLDLLRNMVPPNIVAACFRSYKTVQTPVARNQSDGVDGTTMVPVGTNMAATQQPVVELEELGGYQDRSNVLGLVVFSCVLGIVLGQMGPEGEPLRALANSLLEAIMRLVRCIIWFSPIGIFFLILGKILIMDDWATVFSQIGLYAATVVSGLLIHGVLVLPIIFVVFTRRNPFTFIKGVSPALVTVFATSSSSAALSVTINCVEQNNRIDKRVSRFMLPIGSTINRNGTALYEAVAVIFIAEVNGKELDVATLVTIWIMAVLTSTATAGIPQAGLVTVVIVLDAVGLPAEDISHVIIIDWLVERIRTTVSVTSDSFGAGIVNHLSRGQLASMDRLDGKVNEGFAELEPHREYDTRLGEFNTTL